MKIYFPLWQDDPHKSGNPYVFTIVDAVNKEDNDIITYFGLDFLWNPECEEIDIVHVMWPNCFDEAIASGKNLSKRLRELKNKGVKIISTCHNLHSHIEHNQYSNDTYKIVYELTDVFIHLAMYSKKCLETIYPNAIHQIIPHHVYDTVYNKPFSRSESLKHLKLPNNKTFIFCCGAFRNETERKLIQNIGDKIHKDGIWIIAPSLLFKPRGHKNPLTWMKFYYEKFKYRRIGVIVDGGYIDDNELPYYYGAADLSFIQRVDTLNSGNLPLGFYMGKVVVGPKLGNIGGVLRETGNPSFNVGDFSSVIDSINDGLILYRKGKGIENQRYGNENWSTNKIALMHLQLYHSLVD